MNETDYFLLFEHGLNGLFDFKELKVWIIKIKKDVI